MADGKELKPKSIRITEETAEKFKEVSAALGGNQQEALSKLIETYEYQLGKNILTDKKADIDQFERYVNAISRMYMATLEDNQNITETVRTEFDALLKSKDVTIQNLQEQLAKAKQLQVESAESAKIHEEENTRLKNHIDKLSKEYDAKLDDLQTMLSDKDKLNKALANNCTDLKEKVEEMKADTEHAAELVKQWDGLIQTQENTAKELEQLKKQLQQTQASHEEAMERQKDMAQISLDKALIDLERQYQEQIQTLKAEKQAEIDRYQQKYLELLEQLKINKTQKP